MRGSCKLGSFWINIQFWWSDVKRLTLKFSATVCGFIRFIYVIRTRRAGGGTGSGTCKWTRLLLHLYLFLYWHDDDTDEAYYLAIFTILELHVGVICASVTGMLSKSCSACYNFIQKNIWLTLVSFSLALKPLFSKTVPAVISSLRSSGNKISGGNGTGTTGRSATHDVEAQQPISIKVQQTFLVTSTEIGMDDLALGGSSTFSRDSQEHLKSHYWFS